jgi:uncharacterized protein with HEPN domain
MRRSGWDYLEHMMEDCIDINAAVGMVGTVAEFKQNRILHKSVIYSLLNLGELCKTLTDVEKAAYPHIPWNRIIGFRNRSSHGYHHLDLDIVYEIATVYIPKLIDVLQQQLR